eukprot:gene62175-85023_t
MAIVAYAVLHRFAVAEVSTNVAPGQVGQMVVGQLVKSLATWGQYLVPLLLLAGAAASAIGRRKRQGLIAEVAGDTAGTALRTMSWRDFELLVGEAFRMRGYTVTETGGGMQEETTALGVPCVTIRENTERPITVSEGTNVLAGTDPGRVVALLALAGCLAPAMAQTGRTATAAAAKKDVWPGLPPGATEDYMALRDGVRLGANVFKPVGVGPWPVVLTMTPSGLSLWRMVSITL